ncbi:MAG: DNA gyrase inhibitor YacG [Hyphomicrobium sp.]|jgi:endogenous inhibitor of DNA gyrase (YacG/DUF329 family)
MASTEKPASGYGRCPICGEKTEQAFRPFCSKRCRDVDLARWLGDGYAIPGGAPEADEDGEEPGAGETRGAPRRDDDEPG